MRGDRRPPSNAESQLPRRSVLAAAIRFHPQVTELSYLIGNRTYLLGCDLWPVRTYAAQERAADATQLLHSLQPRESRPDASARIARELQQRAA